MGRAALDFIKYSTGPGVLKTGWIFRIISIGVEKCFLFPEIISANELSSSNQYAQTRKPSSLSKAVLNWLG